VPKRQLNGISLPQLSQYSIWVRRWFLPKFWREVLNEIAIGIARTPEEAVPADAFQKFALPNFRTFSQWGCPLLRGASVALFEITTISPRILDAFAAKAACFFRSRRLFSSAGGESPRRRYPQSFSPQGADASPSMVG